MLGWDYTVLTRRGLEVMILSIGCGVGLDICVCCFWNGYQFCFNVACSSRYLNRNASFSLEKATFLKNN